MSTFVWRPTSVQRELFEEWEGYALLLLVTSKNGIRVKEFDFDLEVYVEETVPLEKMGFPTINHFLYEMGKSIEVRQWYNAKSKQDELVVFLGKFHVPQNSKHIRDMVNSQNESSRKPKITKKNSKLVHMSELLEQAPRGPSRRLTPPAKHTPRRSAPSTSRAPFNKANTMKPRAHANDRLSPSDFKQTSAAAPVYPLKDATKSRDLKSINKKVESTGMNYPRLRQDQEDAKKVPRVPLREPRPVERILRDPRSARFAGISAPKPSSSSSQSKPATISQLRTVEKVARDPVFCGGKRSTSGSMQGAVETVSSNSSSERSPQEAVDGIPTNPEFLSLPRNTSAAAIGTSPANEVNDASSTKPANHYVIPQKRNSAAAAETFVGSLPRAGQAQPQPTSGELIQMQSVGKPSPAQPLPLPEMLTESLRGRVQTQVASAKVPIFNPSLVRTVCPRHSVDSIFSVSNNEQKMKFLKDLKIASAASTLPKVIPRKLAQLTLSLETFMDYYMG